MITLLLAVHPSTSNSFSYVCTSSRKLVNTVVGTQRWMSLVCQPSTRKQGDEMHRHAQDQ